MFFVKTKNKIQLKNLISIINNKNKTKNFEQLKSMRKKEVLKKNINYFLNLAYINMSKKLDKKKFSLKNLKKQVFLYI